jgi:hypothetical protein
MILESRHRGKAMEALNARTIGIKACRVFEDE